MDSFQLTDLSTLVTGLLKVGAVFISMRLVAHFLYLILVPLLKFWVPSTANEELKHNINKTIKTLLIYGGYLAALIISLELLKVPLVEREAYKLYGLRILKAIVIFIVARVILNLALTMLNHIFAENQEGGILTKHRRAGTLRALLGSILKYGIYFIASIMVLETFNVKTGSLLAGAGIAGLAVGFGAQNLVRDIITGFFIIFEDQFTVGEYITTAGVTGVVEELGLRTTKIREWTGQLHIIPNGEIVKVTNFNRGQMLAVVELGISYEADLDQAIEVLRKVSKEAAEKLPAIVEAPVVQGVIALRDFDVLIRVVARTVAGEQWATERELRKILKRALDDHGIEIPYPKRVIINQGEAASGVRVNSFNCHSERSEESD